MTATSQLLVGISGLRVDVRSGSFGAVRGTKRRRRLPRHVTGRGLAMTAASVIVVAIVVLTLLHKPDGDLDTGYTSISTTPTADTTVAAVLPSKALATSDAPSISTYARATPPAADIPPSASPNRAKPPAVSRPAPPAAVATKTSPSPTSTTSAPTTRQYHQPPAPTEWAPFQVHR